MSEKGNFIDIRATNPLSLGSDVYDKCISRIESFIFRYEPYGTNFEILRDEVHEPLWDYSFKSAKEVKRDLGIVTLEDLPGYGVNIPFLILWNTLNDPRLLGGETNYIGVWLAKGKKVEKNSRGQARLLIFDHVSLGSISRSTLVFDREKHVFGLTSGTDEISISLPVVLKI